MKPLLRSKLRYLLLISVLCGGLKYLRESKVASLMFLAQSMRYIFQSRAASRT